VCGKRLPFLLYVGFFDVADIRVHVHTQLSGVITPFSVFLGTI